MHIEKFDNPQACNICHDTAPRQWASKLLCKTCCKYRYNHGIDRPADVYEPYLITHDRLAPTASTMRQQCSNCCDTAPEAWRKDLCIVCYSYHIRTGVDRPAEAYESYLRAREQHSDNEET